MNNYKRKTYAFINGTFNDLNKLMSFDHFLYSGFFFIEGSINEDHIFTNGKKFDYLHNYCWKIR